VRLEHKGGAHTRLWFVTEGIFSRQIVNDPFLEDVGVIVLDEFHERHLQGDVALAVVRELQSTIRPDLKLVVMSATLDTERIAEHLDRCAVIRSEGRTYPVRVEHAGDGDARVLSARVCDAVGRLLRENDGGGDVLVFLPGIGEIRRVADAVAQLIQDHDVALEILHGDLPLEAQRRVLAGSDRRRLVLATNVAETALTVEGVTAVVDSGLVRAARFDSRRGINHLEVRRISRASADQRAGRAGRTSPGRCVRLWSAAEHSGRLAHDVPEILRLDLSSILLELRAWGLGRARELAWLDRPPDEALSRAEDSLARLGALDAETGEITEIGRRLLSLSAPPRLARILVEAQRRGCSQEASLIAALASERDVSVGDLAARRRSHSTSVGKSDLIERLDSFEEAERAGFRADACHRAGVDPRRARSVDRARRQLLRALGRSPNQSGDVSEDELLRCILVGFADRVARRRAPGSSRALMVGRTGVVLDEASVVREAEYFVAVELERGGKSQGSEARVRLASAVRKEWLYEVPGAIHRSDELVFDSERQRVLRRRRECFFDLVLDEETNVDVDRHQAGKLLAEVVRADPTAAFALDSDIAPLLARMAFLYRELPELEWCAPSALLAEAAASLCSGCVSLAELRRRDVGSAIIGLMTAPQRHALMADAPMVYRLPSGREAHIDYGGEGGPAVEARIQELFGLLATPSLAWARVRLVIRIVGPNYRPVQITNDLESFWRTTYPEVRKQLRGRYPKHNWPEDPFSAQPTSKVGRRQPR